MGNCEKQINQIPLYLQPQYFDLIALLKNTPKKHGIL